MITAKLIQLSHKNWKVAPQILNQKWMALMKLKGKHKIQLTEILLDLILQSEAVTIGEESKLLYINQEPTSVQVSKFLFDLQQPTKKIDQSEYF